MKISRTAIAVAGALPAGMLLEAVAQATTSVSADTVHMIGGIAAFTGLVSGSASVSWFGAKAAVDRHEETARMRRHRRAPAPLPRRERPRTVAPATISGAEAEEIAAEDRQALAAALENERAERPAYVDPYLSQAAVDAARAPMPVDADGYPAPATPAQTRLEANLAAGAWTPAAS